MNFIKTLFDYNKKKYEKFSDDYNIKLNNSKLQNFNLEDFKNIRNKLRNIKNINDVINILKEINVCNSDNLLNIIYTCYLIEPPSDIELQKLSQLQQLYSNKLNIQEYSIMTLWCSTIYYIDNLPKIKKQKTWP